jgi:uncharacterized protein with HEPN domain
VSDDTLYLEHIIERCERVARSIASGRDEFYDSEEKQDAIIRNIEVIGEAAKRILPPTREAIASVDWRAVCGMRDVLIHNYVGVDLEEVWNVAVNDLPKLEKDLRKHIEKAKL